MAEFIITLPWSQYDLNNVEMDIKHETIIITEELLMSTCNICFHGQMRKILKKNMLIKGAFS